MSSGESEEDSCVILQPTKKRKVTGRLSEVSKKLRNQTLETGDPCNCKRFKCFVEITPQERQTIINDLNSMSSYNEQNSHLSGLISIHDVQKRRPRPESDRPTPNDCSYSYKVRVKREEKVTEIPICHKAFLSLHGITNRRTITLKSSLVIHGKAHIDKRGKHSNRPHKITKTTFNNVCDHIKSFKSRKAHYSLHDSSKTYLDENLNVKKMHDLFIQDHRDIKISYETYRDIFNKHFNISFGYPRTDTCSQCDEFKSKIKQIEIDLKETSINEETRLRLSKQKKDLEVSNNVHKTKAEKFYSIKRQSRMQIKKMKLNDTNCIAMDFQKNLPMPNLSTNDVYYKRQLSFFMFNIHELPSKKSFFYTYDETVARKGSNEVTSMLYHYLTCFMDHNVRHLKIFCDSCGGQNKNYCVIKFLYSAVHHLNLLDSVSVIYPIRGHTYLECDKNMALINQKTACETPDEWRDEVRKSRAKPEPFTVVDCKQNMFQSWNENLSQFFPRTCPFPTRPIRELKITKEKVGVFLHRESYSGAFSASSAYQITVKGRKKVKTSLELNNESRSYNTELLKPMYSGPLPVSQAKYKDLMHLKRFCNPTAKEFFENLIPAESQNDSGSEEVDENN